VKCGVECESDDEWLIGDSTVSDCANACITKPGCIFFSHGTGEKDGHCYWEKTSNRNCPEDWQSDSFNFYEIKGKNYLLLLLSTYNFIILSCLLVLLS